MKPFRRGRISARDQRQAVANSLSLLDGGRNLEFTQRAIAAVGPKPSPRAKPQRKEAPVLKAVLQALRRHPKVASVERSQAGQIPIAGGYIRLGSKGKLDITGFLKGGRYFEIEAKAPGRKPEPHQQARIDSVRANGGISGYCTSVDEALAIIDG